MYVFQDLCNVPKVIMLLNTFNNVVYYHKPQRYTTKCWAFTSTNIIRSRFAYKVATPPPPRPPNGGNNGNMGGGSWDDAGNGDGDNGGNQRNNTDLFIGLAMLCVAIVSLAEIHVSLYKKEEMIKRFEQETMLLSTSQSTPWCLIKIS